MWNYAKLSQMAKAMGGPEKLMKEFTKRGIELGVKQAKTKYAKFIGAAFVAGTGVGWLVAVGVGKIKTANKTINGEEASAAEQVIIDGIDAYDLEIAEHPEKEALPELSREEAEKSIDQYIQRIADEMNREEEKPNE